MHTPAISSRIHSWKWLRRIRRSLRPFLDLHQAEDLLASSNSKQIITPAPTDLPNSQEHDLKDSPAGRRAVEKWSAKFHAVRLAAPLFLGGLLETLAWLAIACYGLASASTGTPLIHPHTSSSAIAAFVIASVWGYIPLRVAFSPSIRVHARPPPDVLILLLTLGTAALVDGAGRVYETYVYSREWVSFRSMGWWTADMGMVCALIWVIIVTPLELPSERVSVEKIVSSARPFGLVVGTPLPYLGSRGQSGRLREYMGVDLLFIRHSAHQAGAFTPQELPSIFYCSIAPY